MHTKFLSETLKGNNYSGDLDVDRKIILKLMKKLG